MSDQLAKESLELRTELLSNSSDWRGEAWDNIDFTHGKMWTTEQAENMDEWGQIALKVDRTTPILEQKTAMATANYPTWIIEPAGWGTDDIKAHICRSSLDYIWRFSDGRTANRDACWSSFVTGRGVLMARVDPFADYGQGEIVIWSVVEPQEILVTDSCSRRDWEDADDILFHRIYTFKQAKRTMPEEYWETIQSQLGVFSTEEISHKTDRYAGESQKQPSDIQEDMENKCLIIERYTKDFRKIHILTPLQQGMGLPAKEVEELSDADKRLINDGFYVETQGRRPKVKRIVSVGAKYLYSDILPTHLYPMAPIIHRHTETPYSLGEVHRIKDQQLSINKRHALIIRAASVGTNPRTIYPMGSIDVEYWGNQGAVPGALLGYEPLYGGLKPEFETPQIGNSIAVLGQIVGMETAHMEYTSGVDKGDLGVSQGAPRTLGQTLAFRQFGQTRIRDFLSTSVEPALIKLARVTLHLIPSVWSLEKLLRVTGLDLNAMLTPTQQQYVMRAQPLAKQFLEDIFYARYDIKVKSGSTMEVNPLAVQQHFLELANVGAIDREEIIRQDPYIQDKEGLLSRLSERDQLKSQMEQLGNIAKRQQEEIKTLTNQIRNARIDRDTAMHKAVLKDEEYRTRAELAMLRKEISGIRKKLVAAETDQKKVPRRKLKGEK